MLESRADSSRGTAMSAPPIVGSLVDVQGLKVHYAVRGGGFLVRSKNTLKAVDGIDLQIREGETLGLVGESGCGKSTTGRTMLYLERPTAGTVRYQGTEL